ncbi:nicotinate-nucleotide--dimethylbenzimidazole phosphoribosyltransferase [Acidimangrovimonas pyrenivorans]|uniref:Nicotinate-nucleotide--dimethylbenzimidazole phosphoribosyltransferase n=1 Tax=Acidimangrovimonas pyrenivorans TaxID=2030798 RepID=A0ABV7AJI4_9RHOB
MTDRLFPLSALADLGALAAVLPGLDAEAAEAARARQNALTKPPGSLGRLEELAIFMAGWHGRERPGIARAQALVFAGNHGVCAQGVNPFPQEVTAQMVANFEAGGAAINQLCRANGAALEVIALDLDRPTGDFTQGPAMSEAECLEALNRGAAAVDPRADVLILGEMGIGNSTVAAALAAAVFGGAVADWTGPGTGSDADGMARKIGAIERGLERHAALLADAPRTLAALGGREQAAICGAVLAARAARVPVILDGFICTAAVAPLHGIDPALLDHCLVGHVSAEPGHRRLLEAMGKAPVLAFDMRLGEGSGAALALGILRSALACHDGMATFAEAGVSGGEVSGGEATAGEVSGGGGSAG